MTSYDNALRGMERLLNDVGETHWRDWIRQDLQEWEAAGTASHHLSAYGAMGSFSDVVLCRANGHRVTEAQEPWVDRLFNDLQSACYYLATHLGKPTFAWSLVRSMGNIGSTLDGWRCVRCSYAEVTPKDLDRYIAYGHVRQGIVAAFKAGALDQFIDRVLAVDFRELPAERRRVAKTAAMSGISLRAREGWMRPCPACQSSDTIACYWVKERWRDVFKPKGGHVESRAT